MFAWMPLILPLLIAAIIFQFMAYRRLSSDYQDQGRRMMNKWPRREYFTKKGWFFHRVALGLFVLCTAALLLGAFLSA